MTITLRKLYISIIILAAMLAGGCIEDGYTDSPSDQPLFSTDTLNIGTVFTDEPTPTSRFTVYNPHSKLLSISDISITGTDADCFRLNVDGISGKRFAAVDIRGKDSIFVFVEATLPAGATPQTDFSAAVSFTTNGVTKSVVLAAKGQNVRRLKGLTLTADTHFDDEMPYQVYDSLVVAPGATLSLTPGTNLLFHDKAMLIVRGRLISEGTVDNPVNMAGDRTGNVVSDISFDIMSRQWQGVFITPSSTGNVLSHTDMRNTVQGLTLEGSPDIDYSSVPQLRVHNSRLHNSGGLVIEAYHSAITATGSEFAEAAEGLVFLHGGTHSFVHCTFANNYLFTAISGPAIQLSHLSADSEKGLDDLSGRPYLKANFDNSIVYGIGNDLSHGDLAGTTVLFRSCLLKSKGSDDDNFIGCIWESDPLYYTVRTEYLFDYRLKPESPAIAAADASLTPAACAVDAYGRTRTSPADLGAYVYVAPEE